MKKPFAQQALTINSQIEELKNARRALCKSLLQEAAPMDPERFASLAQGLRTLIQKDPRRENHEEFLRRATCQETYREETNPKDFEEALSFIKAYGEKTKEIYRALDEIPTGRGDDGHGDLMDSLALCPKPILDELLQNPEDFEAWEEKYEAEINDILNAELYNNSRLEEACQTYVATAARTQFPQMEEQPADNSTQEVNVHFTQDFGGTESKTSITIKTFERPIAILEIENIDFLRILTQSGQGCRAQLTNYQKP